MFATLMTCFQNLESTKTTKKTLDLGSLGFDKLLGGGNVKNAYAVKINQATSSAKEKIKQAGGEVLTSNG